MTGGRYTLQLPLGNDPSSDLLVDNDTNSVLGDIEDPTGLSVVELVWHTLLEGTIALDVNNISLFEYSQEGREGLNTVFPEFTGKQVASAAAITLRVNHLESYKETNQNSKV